MMIKTSLPFSALEFTPFFKAAYVGKGVKLALCLKGAHDLKRNTREAPARATGKRALSEKIRTAVVLYLILYHLFT